MSKTSGPAVPDMRGMTDFLLVPSRVMVTVRLSLMRGSLSVRWAPPARIAGLAGRRRCRAGGFLAGCRLWRQAFLRNLCKRREGQGGAPIFHRFERSPWCASVLAAQGLRTGAVRPVNAAHQSEETSDEIRH